MSEPSGARDHSDPPGAAPQATPIVTPSRVVAGLCLVAPFVAMLWVGSYAQVSPRLIGIPFFYWYQLLWVPLSAGLTSVAYLLVRREQRELKEPRAGRLGAVGAAGAAGTDAGINAEIGEAGESGEGGASE